jgi:methylenetetrahydrofolate dehydrogenase (NADP+)/methenyltetrahydrofolate cyclohydrolase
MECRLIDGVSIAADIRKELKKKVAEFKAETNVTPTLVALMVGNNPASQIYVQKKLAACDEVGILAYRVEAKEDEDDLAKQIHRLNNDDSVNGYILQLPLPTGWRPDNFFSLFDPQKDVDVFHPENVGLLVQGRPRFKPCTPHGIQVMLHRSGIRVAGKKVVVINRSNVVGKPLSSMLIQECDDYANATVTVCHDRTPPSILKSITQTADIVIVAVGKPGFLTADMIQPGDGVVDVGITRVNGKVLGDADPDIRQVAAWVTPVPGGVGPMTVAMLLENTLAAAKLQVKSALQS